MKNLTKAFKTNIEKFWNDEEAQGMIEYILILVAVVAIVSLAGGKIKTMIGKKADAVGGEIGGVTSDSF